MNDMERIQRGLEEFLEQELEEEGGGNTQTEPQIFDLREENKTKKEPEVINISRNTGKSRRSYEIPEEDWDSTPRRNAGERNRRSDSGHREQSGRRDTEQDPRREQNGHKPPRRKKRHRLRRLLIKVLLLAVLLFGGLYLLEGPVYDKMNYEEIESLAGEPMQEDGVVNILLIGNDSRENGEDGRSDAMILLSISKNTKKIYMTSLLRDMYVEIPGYDGNRLNAAYAYGGAELLLETVEQNLGITVNRYVLVNFEAFANLVDAVGGVDLELTQEEVELVNGYLWEYNILTGREEGTDYMDTDVYGLVHLNGPQALSYSRNRAIGTDFGRTERQRKVLNEVLKQLPKAVLTNPTELIGGLMPNLTTNLTRWECYRLSLMAPKVLTYDIESGSIPLEGTYTDATIRSMAVLQVDFDANREYLQELLYGSEDTEETTDTE